MFSVYCVVVLLEYHLDLFFFCTHADWLVASRAVEDGKMFPRLSDSFLDRSNFDGHGHSNHDLLQEGSVGE